ncbi:MAG: 1-deoxy-D-xylulose-5-phosphate synthase [Planctomycetota bacterium]
MDKILSTIGSPSDLQKLSQQELTQLAADIREALCGLASRRTAHFASNLGVVELTLALHTTFDFSRDRLIWDTGHQIYPHKLVTGRYKDFHSMRVRGGLMGYPNPAESPYDLFLTGHAGCAISCVLGMRCADDLLRPDENRYSVAVVGDGAFSSGVVLEALNHAGGLKKNLIVILNDNKMSICPRVGALAESLDRVRTNSLYTTIKLEVQKMLARVPVIGDPVERFLHQVKDAAKAGLVGGMLFQDLGFHYHGPVDGHDIRHLQKYLAMAKQVKGPVLLHVVTEKGHGYDPAVEDPALFHTPGPFSRDTGEISFKSNGARPYTAVASDTLLQEMRREGSRVAVITAAMCQGNMLEPIRDQFPDRFFDVGICESHAVALAAGMAKGGIRPVVDIYSTFMQRSYDQIFQEVSLQDLPVTLLLDRAGVVGPDGSTHHGVFDIAYLRVFPNLVIMSPGDQRDLEMMIPWALNHDHPTAIRYPKANVVPVSRDVAPLELGESELVRPGTDGVLIAFGPLLSECIDAAEKLAEEGLELAVINARFVKPLDTRAILQAVREHPFVVTVEEGCLMGGFGSAVLEAANDAGLDTRHIRRMGIPDQYVEHADRSEQLAHLGLSSRGIAETCRKLASLAPPRLAAGGARS